MYILRKIKSQILTKFVPLKEWVVAHEKELFVGLLVLLSSTLSFGVGRATKLRENQPPVTITAAVSTSQESIKIIEETDTVDNRIVASQKGTKYYYPWCGSGKNIKVENRRYFATAVAAESAGYTRAANCSAQP